ncbi:hypothetical protein B0J17DRAFT_747320, partial [Rhizoctonia solani]
IRTGAQFVFTASFHPRLIPESQSKRCRLERPCNQESTQFRILLHSIAMVLPVSGPCSSGLNYSSRFSNTRDSTEKCLLRFSEDFMHSTDDVSVWYNKQPFSRFHTIQYRKEKTAIGHEFILLRLQGKDGSDTESYCRVERVGDIEHRFQAICVDGTIAEDYIQAIPLNNPESARLTHNSDIVAEITFPLTFDLRDVLAICYAISKHKRAKRYTLISKYIDEQGPARLHSVAYILSNSTYPESDNGEEYPLDKLLLSWEEVQGGTMEVTVAQSGHTLKFEKALPKDEPFVKEVSIKARVKATTGNNISGPPQAEVHNAKTSVDTTEAAEKIVAFNFDKNETPNMAKHGPDPWPYNTLLYFIRERISRLSKRENKFAPFLKRIPLMKTPKVCQM